MLYQTCLYVYACMCRHWNVFSKRGEYKIMKTLHSLRCVLCHSGVGHTANTVDWFSQLLLAQLLKASITKQLSFCESASHSVVSNSLRPHGLYSPWNLQTRILKWVGFPFFRGFSQPRDWIQVSCIAGRFFTSWATREALPSVISIFFRSQTWNLHFLLK